jgi:hypothetical protein
VDIGVAMALVGVALFLLERVPLPFALLLQRSPAALFPFVLPSLYLLLKDGFGGKSIGKLIAGLVVWDLATGRPASFVDSINRNWPLAVPVFGPSVVALIAGAQILAGRAYRVGDRAASTVITDAESLEWSCASA